MLVQVLPADYIVYRFVDRYSSSTRNEHIPGNQINLTEILCQHRLPVRMANKKRNRFETRFKFSDIYVLCFISCCFLFNFDSRFEHSFVTFRQVKIQTKDIFVMTNFHQRTFVVCLLVFIVHLRIGRHGNIHTQIHIHDAFYRLGSTQLKCWRCDSCPEPHDNSSSSVTAVTCSSSQTICVVRD
jgi:hypothetical protein